jgi:hypothetical protein
LEPPFSLSGIVPDHDLALPLAIQSPNGLLSDALIFLTFSSLFPLSRHPRLRREAD